MGTSDTAIGIDFGTTNSAIARSDGREVRLGRYGHDLLSVFRTLLFFQEPDPGTPPIPTAGPYAIEAYLEDNEGRLIQSIKSYLTSESFKATDVYGRHYTLDHLLTFFLKALRTEAEKTLGRLDGPVVVGRPVQYVGEGPRHSEALALERMEKALGKAGFGAPSFVYEPVGAAYQYEATLDHDELVMVADFGGGTSDFCLMYVGPGMRGSDRKAAIMGTDGVPIAGDVFDSRLVHHVVAPELGLGSRYQTSPDHYMEVPKWLFGHLARWHLLSFLKGRKTIQMLIDMRSTAEAPEKLGNFLNLIREDLGYQLFRRVEQAKIALTDAAETHFLFEAGGAHIERTITRGEFEGWIAGDVAEIAGSVDRLLKRTGADARDVDRVFMTGGTSYVPSVRRLFEARFGAERITLGDRFTSVAAGLARAAADARA